MFPPPLTILSIRIIVKNMKGNTSQTTKTRWHELLGDMLEKLLVPVGIDAAVMGGHE